MVDQIQAFVLTEPPSLHACRYVGANDPVFDGHFPHLMLLPGALVLEGLGQCCALLAALLGTGLDATELQATLANLDRALMLDPNHDAPSAAATLASLRQATGLAVMGAVSLKFVRPVFAGCRLDYHVVRVATSGPAWQFRVEASVDGEVVARGTLSGSDLNPPIPAT